MKVYLLDLGSLVIDRSDVLWHIDVGTPVRFPVYGVYIDHPEGKFIFDTGYDLDHVNKVLPFELPEQTPEQTLPAQLGLLWHEAGGDRLRHQLPLPFRSRRRQQVPHQRDAASPARRSCARALVPEPFERLGYSDLTFHWPGPESASSSRATPRSRRASPCSTRPGHTIGHVSLLAEPEGRRPMIFCGDACYTFETLERMIIGGFHLDPVKSISALKRIKPMAKEHDAEIFPSHDMEPWHRLEARPGVLRRLIRRSAQHEAPGPGGDRHRQRAGHRQGDRGQARRAEGASGGRRGRRTAPAPRQCRRVCPGRHGPRPWTSRTERRSAAWWRARWRATASLDILVNNAAIVPFTAWDDIDFAEWRRIMAVNLDGVFLTCRAASDEMRKTGYGRIVNIASNVDGGGHPEPRPLRRVQGRRVRVHAVARDRARQVRHHGQRAWRRA